MKDRRNFIKQFSLASLLTGGGLFGQAAAQRRQSTPASTTPGTQSPLRMGTSALRGLVYPRDCRSRRISSYDRTGANIDNVPIPAGETTTLAAIEGAGCISHIWVTVRSPEEHYLRRLIFRAYWDDETRPSIEAPIGDFFGVGHARVQNFQSLPLNMVTGGDVQAKDQAAMNCFFPMPFSRGARFTVTNEGSEPVKAFYYYIDYEEYPAIADDLLRFHAQWRREFPTTGTIDLSRPDVNTTTLSSVNGIYRSVNTDGRENYVILEAAGRGHYVGCNLSIDHINPIHNWEWFGEGDDMIFIDGEQMPSIIGTGTEDYFCAAWGYPSGQYSGLYHGISLANPPDNGPVYSGKWTMYRFHIEDPITFNRSIKVTIEHGHANIHANDYSSVAYWYQTEPHAAFPPLPAVADRLPLSDGDSQRRFYKTY